MSASVRNLFPGTVQAFLLFSMPEESSPMPVVPRADWTKLILPGAIVIAAILVSGTLVYTRGKAVIGNPSPAENGTVLTPDNLKKWARSIGLDSKEFNRCLDTHAPKAEIAKDIVDGTAAGVSGTPTFYVNGRQIVGAQPFANFQAVIEAVLKKKPGQAISVSEDDDPMLGDPGAPVTIIEFSDFQCPFCQKFHSETFPQIKKTYIDTGKVRFVYRDFPLSFHPGAQPAAEAAECAHAQGKFWEMHEALFSEQQK